jgi:hypothetical protein
MLNVVRVNDPGFLELMEDYCNSGKTLFLSTDPKERYETLKTYKYEYAAIRDSGGFDGVNIKNFRVNILTIEEARRELGLDMKIDIENGKYIVSYNDPQAIGLLNFLKERYGTLYKNQISDWDNFQVDFKNPNYIGMGCNNGKTNGQKVEASDILNTFKKNEVTLEEVYNLHKRLNPTLLKIESNNKCCTFYCDKDIRYMLPCINMELGTYPKQVLDNGTKVIYNDREYTFLSKYDTNVLVREDDFVILAASNNIEELEKQGVKEVKS